MLARLGGRLWEKQKKRVESAVTDMAAEMLELQAVRASRPGISFRVETEWQHEFDASFPYKETPDQLTSLEAIKQDMHASRPMDRLLCGDVGYGKTEVAMRAAFKAIDSGYQVAVLVPTTVLAEQHLRTFSARMAEFPFSIAALSRFSTPRQQAEIIERLAAGSVDIVIGTHRLVQPDVKFHNLGLIIIDEEQRFGVEVKERLKAMRQTVDVLTMTATPIPRTLHMGLIGVRDISNLETPPEDRLAVETRVTRFHPELIRQAVLRELNRQGQIYFVHNRVQDIQALAKRLGQIVPEARIGVAHGQMAEHELERVMLDFVAHRFDILLATTIIESGLDIPNANTIFIDEADRYGLADLHQLRGRVGRYIHRAYCYLLLDPNKNLTSTSARRLKAIEEFSQMGAGFAIAMRDLEIRGAGNILGTAAERPHRRGGLRAVLLAPATGGAPSQAAAAQAGDRGRYRPAGRRPHSAELRARHAVENRPLPPAGPDFQAGRAGRPAERTARSLRRPAAAGRASALAGRTADCRPSLANRVDPPGAALRRLPLPLGTADPRTGSPKWGKAEDRRQPKCLSAPGRRQGIAGIDSPAGQIAVAASIARMPIIRPRSKSSCHQYGAILVQHRLIIRTGAGLIAVLLAVNLAILRAQDPFPPVPPGGYMPNGQPQNGYNPVTGLPAAPVVPYQPMAPIRPAGFPGGPIAADAAAAPAYGPI